MPSRPKIRRASRRSLVESSRTLRGRRPATSSVATCSPKLSRDNCQSKQRQGRAFRAIVQPPILDKQTRRSIPRLACCRKRGQRLPSESACKISESVSCALELGMFRGLSIANLESRAIIGYPDCPLHRPPCRVALTKIVQHGFYFRRVIKHKI